MKTKKLLLSLSAFAFSCMLAGGVGVAKASASADGTVANTPTTVDFNMEAGAAVRVSSNSAENGIRYQVTMPAREYAALEANTAYKSVSYGILIAPKSYHTENALNKANVFGETPKYDWAVKEDGEWVYKGQNGKNDSPKRIMNFETDVLSTWSKDENVKTFFGSITDIHQDNLPRDFVGLGYIKYETDTAVDYVFAEENDNVRSMSQVALSAYKDADSQLSATDKAALKKVYIDDVYGNSFEFDKASSTYLAKNGENVSFKNDNDCSDGYGLQGNFYNVKNDYTSEIKKGDFKINLGGEYQFKDISKITVRYKITYASKASDAWWRIFLNDNVANGQELVKGNGLTFSDETARGGGTMSKFATLTITPSATYNNTKLTENDYLDAISFAYRYNYDNERMCTATIIIDSVVVYTGYQEKYLDFNEEAALGLVEEGYNTKLVDLGNGNKALQFDLCQWYNGGTRYNLKLNVGGEYQVKQIKQVDIRYKVVSVSGATVSSGWQVHLNHTGAYTGDIFNKRITGLTHNAFTSMNNFVTNEITSDGTTSSLTANSLSQTLLSQEDYLQHLYLCVNGSGTNSVVTIQIDYIKITLKA